MHPVFTQVPQRGPPLHNRNPCSSAVHRSCCSRLAGSPASDNNKIILSHTVVSPLVPCSGLRYSIPA